MSKKIITVLGASGNQGAAVVKYLLRDGQWAVRAVTRNKNSESAKKLPAEVEVVEADATNAESLNSAFKGAYGVFAVTQPFDAGNAKSGQTEETQGKNIVDAAVKNGVTHLLWSAAPNSLELSGGKFNVPHMIQKDNVTKYLKEQKIQWTILYPGFFLSNYTNYPPSVKEGVLEHNFPAKPDLAPGQVDVDDIGRVAAAAFEHPNKAAGQSYHIVGEFKSFPDVLELIAKKIGKKAEYHKLDEETYGKWTSPDLAEMHRFFNSFPANAFEQSIKTDNTKDLVGSDLHTVQQWVDSVDWKTVLKL